MVWSYSVWLVGCRKGSGSCWDGILWRDNRLKLSAILVLLGVQTDEGLLGCVFLFFTLCVFYLVESSLFRSFVCFTGTVQYSLLQDLCCGVVLVLLAFSTGR